MFRVLNCFVAAAVVVVVVVVVVRADFRCWDFQPLDCYLGFVVKYSCYCYFVPVCVQVRQQVHCLMMLFPGLVAVFEIQVLIFLFDDMLARLYMLSIHQNVNPYFAKLLCQPCFLGILVGLF